jgi:hypothetical protein
LAPLLMLFQWVCLHLLTHMLLRCCRYHLIGCGNCNM